MIFAAVVPAPERTLTTSPVMVSVCAAAGAVAVVGATVVEDVVVVDEVVLDAVVEVVVVEDETFTKSLTM